MVEMVYNSKETEELSEVRVPKNIRQIGDSKSGRKIYIEDYVMNSLKKKPDIEENVRYGVLLGEIKRAKGSTYVFVKGMVETREVIENSIIFNDDIWATIYKDIKSYFEGFEIVGWFVSVPYTVGNDMASIQKTHLDNFAGNDKVCYLSDRSESEDGFFSYESGKLEKQTGYYIFYEKNEKMKKYLKQTNGNRSVVVSAEEAQSMSDKKNVVSKKVSAKKVSVESKEAIKNSEPINKKETATDKENGQNKAKQHLSFRDILKQQVEEDNAKLAKPGRLAYGISSMLIIALLLSTVVMLNNYGELKNLKNSIEKMSNDDSVVAVNEILSSIMPTTASGEQGSEGVEDSSQSQTESNMTEKDSTQSAETKEMVDANVNPENDANNSSGDDNSSASANVVESDDEGVQIEANNDEDDDIPEASDAPASAFSGMYHTVTAGQTLYDISVSYYGDDSMVERIKVINSIGDDYLIKEGQKILLP